MLDELSLQEALHHLVNEFAFAERGIRCRFDYRLPTPPESETLVFTLYRLLQELLNNVCKHANAQRRPAAWQKLANDANKHQLTVFNSGSQASKWILH